MKLRTVYNYLKNIIRSEEDPREAIDAFLDAYWLNHVDAEPSADLLWKEIRFLACELKLFDPDTTSRTVGYFGSEHAVVITQKVLDQIAARLRSKPLSDKEYQNTQSDQGTTISEKDTSSTFYS